MKLSFKQLLVTLGLAAATAVIPATASAGASISFHVPGVSVNVYDNHHNGYRYKRKYKQYRNNRYYDPYGYRGDRYYNSSRSYKNRAYRNRNYSQRYGYGGDYCPY